MTDAIQQKESKTIRDDLCDSIVLLNHYTSMIDVSKKLNVEADEQYAEWLVNFMKIVTYTSHESSMTTKAAAALKYFDAEPKKNLYNQGLQLARDYLKDLFSQGIVHYHE